MKPKIVAGLVFALLIALLGLIASDYADGLVMGLSLRKLLVIPLMVVAGLFIRYWQSGVKKEAVGLPSPGRLKPLYLGLAAVSAASYFLMPKAAWADISVAVAMCLTGAFVGREKDQDERVEHLKLNAIRGGFLGAFVVIFGWSWLAATLRGEKFSPHYFSAFDMAIIAILISLGLFHFWRWQDGRAN